MLSDPQVKWVLVNIFGGILRCDIAARGIIDGYRSEGARLPLLVRMRGTNVDEGRQILADSDLDVTFADSLTELAEIMKVAVG